MAIHAVRKYRIEPFWNQEFRWLEYENEQFNDPANLTFWNNLGFPGKYTGDMCDMRRAQPSWNSKIIDFFRQQGWQDIGTSYYRMMPGTILPTHSDLYLRYIDLFQLQGREHNIHRAIVFLEDWQPGHYAEYCDEPFVKWRRGDVVDWQYDTPHMAANMGITPRYTLQVTGHL